MKDACDKSGNLSICLGHWSDTWQVTNNKGMTEWT